MSGIQTYGKELPDQVDRLVALSDVQLELLADVREMHKERVALEREYATKLQALARKAADKKSKKDAALVVGPEPTKAWGEDVLQRSTLHNAYAQLISSVMDTAQAHINLADSLTAEVIDALKVTERRQEEAKKKQEQYFAKLLSERDRVYSDRVKSKQKYDDECGEVESYRQKQGRADDRHAERAAKQFESQQIDMQNSKNVYLISIATSNKIKDKFYSEDLPSLEDQFQTLQTQLIERFVVIMTDAQMLQKGHLDTLRTHIDGVESRLASVNAQADQELFIEHNIRPFTKPGDWAFEPAAVHYDTGGMAVEPAPKVVLQNRLTKCRSKLDELRPVITSKRKEMESFAKMMANNVGIDRAANGEEATDSYLEAQHQLTFYLSSEYMLLAEIDVISAALSGDEGEQKPHTFKSTSFSIPTQCVYCKSSIWGLSKQGKTCKACGISVHAKCELKVPADCPGSRGAMRSTAGSTMSRSSTLSKSSTGSQSMTPSPSSFTPRDSVLHESLPSAQVVYNFTPTSPFELAVTAGSSVQILEEDDGSGWVKVADEFGGKGLIPAAYVQVMEAASSAPGPPPVPVASTRPRGGGQFVRGVYAYQAQGPDELSVQDGGLIELTGGPNGGMNYADGWWEGVDSTGRKGIFPSNYVELAQ
ncbi:hypothetical protein DAEQUDRAFT_732022 [Daedalea quercina L-15889]|uniref:FCH-domain-containing protein n=1 Tax=Daedalea quercina L-15889 TaxID=1314783 RepID=A0A165LW81_9APHY|nr:hypothetical protein DAEQUDRAFT_732022 [Daedalea quercina L-15889]